MSGVVKDAAAQVVQWGVTAGNPAADPLPAPFQPPEPDRRERGRRHRRDRVFTAAVELFVERGFDATTMDDIAERADVARATVFNHFKRKTAFLDEWSARRRERAFDAVRADHLETHSLGEILRRYMVELGRVSIDSRTETVALMGAAMHTTNVMGRPALGDEFSHFIAAANDAGELAGLADPDLAGLTLATAYFAVLIRWIGAEPEPFDLVDALVRVVDMTLHGLLPR